MPDGMRLGWQQTPARVRAAIQSRLGAEVVDAVSQPGGFSPGLAARLWLADGRRVFVKAISADRTPMGPSSYRAEARVTAALPPSVPAPRLLWSYDDGDWVALVLEDIDGHPPAQPWRPEELDRVLAALAALAVDLTPTPVDAPAVTDKWAESCTGWRRLAAAGDRRLAEVAPWAWAHLDRLAELEARWSQAAAGATCCTATSAPTTSCSPRAGWCWWTGRTPASVPPRLPTLRGFQLAQGRAALAWLRRRLGG